MDPISIYEDLKQKIIWLEIKPETVFNLTELAEEYGVSRNPVTVALHRLDSEGWVVRNGKQFIVTPLSLDRVKETYELRVLIETQANIWAMKRITPKEMAELVELETKLKNLGTGANKKEMVELDGQFHQLLERAAKNAQMAKMLQQIRDHYRRFWLYLSKEINPHSFFEVQLEILQAIKNKDEAKLRKASAKHVKWSWDEITSS